MTLLDEAADLIVVLSEEVHERHLDFALVGQCDEWTCRQAIKVVALLREASQHERTPVTSAQADGASD